MDQIKAVCVILVAFSSVGCSSCSIADKSAVMDGDFMTKPQMRTLISSCDADEIVTEPDSLDLRCGPVDLQLRSIKWNNWGEKTTSASALAEVELPCGAGPCTTPPETTSVAVSVQASNRLDHSLTFDGLPIVSQYQKVQVSFQQPPVDGMPNPVMVDLPAKFAKTN